MTISPLELHVHCPDWGIRPLGAVSLLVKDGTHGTHERVRDGIPLLSATHVADGRVKWDEDVTRVSEEDYKSIHATYELKPNDLLLTVVGSLGRRALVRPGSRFTIQRSVAVVRPNPKVLDSAFLFQMTGGFYFQRQLQIRSNTTAQAGLYLGELNRINIPVPPLGEQKKIAEILGSVDEAIQATQAVIDQTRKVKQGLLQQLLTRGIGHTRFKQTEIGEIPESWRVVRIGEHSAFVTSGSRGWAKFLRISNLSRVGLDLDVRDLKYVSLPETMAEGRRTSVLAGDILISITADLGIIGFARPGLGKAYVNQHVALLRLDSVSLDSEFGARALSGPSLQDYIQRQNDPGAKAGLNLTSIRRLPVPCPPLDEQLRIVGSLRECEASEGSARDELRQLSLVKRGLMQALLAGRVRVALNSPPERGV